MTLDWLAQLLGLPDGLHGHIEDTASTCTMAALAAARQAKPGARVVVASEHAHSSVAKACRLLELEARAGAGRRRVPAAPGRARPHGRLRRRGDDRDDLDELGRPGRRRSRTAPRPRASGCTSTRPTPARPRSARSCASTSRAGSAPTRSSSTRTSGCLRRWTARRMWTRRPDDLRAAFSLVPEYLRVTEDVVSLSEYSPVLGRRFRALKLWAVLRCYGRDGLQERIREAIRLAALFEGWVRDEPGWEVTAPRPFSLVCFRRDGSDEENEALLERVNATGEIFISHTRLNGRYSLRLAVGNARTTEEDVQVAWDVLRREAAGLAAKPSSSCSSAATSPSMRTPSSLPVDDEVVEPRRVRLHEHVVVLRDPRSRRAVDERRLLVPDPERDPAAPAERRESEVERMHQPARLERVGRRRAHQAGAEAGELVQHRAQLLPGAASARRRSTRRAAAASSSRRCRPTPAPSAGRPGCSSRFRAGLSTRSV